MMLKVFTIKDQKAELYNVPFYVQSTGEAERNFRTLVNDNRSTIHAYPEDYDLYFIGDFETTTGKMSSTDTPIHMFKAVDLKERSAPQLSIPAITQ